jgi:hypothetical protein
MMRKWFALAAMLYAATPTGALAQEAADPKAWAEQFLSVMVGSGAEQAYQLLSQSSSAARSDPDSMIKVRESMIAAGSNFGAAIGFELVGEKRLGLSLALLTYLVKYERNAIIWELDFYRPRTGWNLHKFRFYDNLGGIPRM